MDRITGVNSHETNLPFPGDGCESEATSRVEQLAAGL